MAGGYVYQLQLRTGGFYELRKSPEHGTVIVNKQNPDRLSSKSRHNPPKDGVVSPLSLSLFLSSAYRLAG
jgi:hypothetical protein